MSRSTPNSDFEPIPCEAGIQDIVAGRHYIDSKTNPYVELPLRSPWFEVLVYRAEPKVNGEGFKRSRTLAIIKGLIDDQDFVIEYAQRIAYQLDVGVIFKKNPTKTHVHI